MDWLTFTATIIQALIWPIAAVLILFLLRNQITSLFSRISRIRVKDIEADFVDTLQRLKKESSLSFPSNRIKESMIIENNEDSYKLAKTSSRYAIMEAWEKVEIAIENLAISKKILRSGLIGRLNPTVVAQMLLDHRIIDDDTLTAFSFLKQLRNRAAFEPDFQLSSGTTRTYLISAEFFVRQLKDIIVEK